MKLEERLKAARVKACNKGAWTSASAYEELRSLLEEASPALEELLRASRKYVFDSGFVDLDFSTDPDLVVLRDALLACDSIP